MHNKENSMYEYKFIRIRISFFGKPKEDYQKIIEENSKKGWRFVQVFAPGIGSYGAAKFFDVIFERRMGN